MSETFENRENRADVQSIPTSFPDLSFSQLRKVLSEEAAVAIAAEALSFLPRVVLTNDTDDPQRFLAQSHHTVETMNRVGPLDVNPKEKLVPNDLAKIQQLVKACIDINESSSKQEVRPRAECDKHCAPNNTRAFENREVSNSQGMGSVSTDTNRPGNTNPPEGSLEQGPKIQDIKWMPLQQQARIEYRSAGSRLTAEQEPVWLDLQKVLDNPKLLNNPPLSKVGRTDSDNVKGFNSEELSQRKLRPTRLLQEYERKREAPKRLPGP
jgi:hypothetical protein